MIETSGVIEKEQGNGFYLVTLDQPSGHQCLCRAAGKLTKFRIKLLAGDKVLVEISPYDLTRGRITYRERNAGATGPRPGGNRPGGPRRR
ncbi:translation initiation factor IF-1 [Synechococcus sp. BSF8S]|jgi:translation initiation factor IF-1|uniref:translation initiation factor IF-1 n=1 Tax=Synechococcales TaxID=1890424 RepID=UPI000069947B|nr:MULTISPECIES: translation initiation factor IF-1 [unclassified Synechococcus]MCX5932837.1 translation initiation factor IF-1 [Cyanobacteriota bacterium]MDM7938414.1 translation initiation factor IF-1 [Cyanobium sp. CZS48M]EAQ75997.1 translation initiation factor [Synechococcus sp. WH 5701]MBC1262191.1 translation initiation factor IF-1 [Synechococcus sp. BSF8S]MBC1265144.1 translation initiation factor IF-1 [Synechococcus sp. BSA11S]